MQYIPTKFKLLVITTDKYPLWCNIILRIFYYSTTISCVDFHLFQCWQTNLYIIQQHISVLTNGGEDELQSNIDLSPYSCAFLTIILL